MSRVVFLIAAAVLLCCSVFVAADVPGDLITSLPGYGTTSSKQYSGLMPVDDAKSVFLHYWFVTATDVNPSTAPVLVWLNGGPGCSSLEGFLYENGPLHFTGETNSSTGVPTLQDNPYAWSRQANVIFLESPAGVGFSYAVNGSTSTTDEITSQNNYGFLKNWMAAYSEFASNPFFITGESYAGIYIPTLAYRVLQGAQSGDNKINMVGFAVGNACWGNSVGICAMYNGGMEGVGEELQFLHGHAMISEPHWQDVLTACGNLSNPNPTDACNDAIDVASNDGGDYNIYDIYDECPAPVLANKKAQTAWVQRAEKRGLSLPKKSASPSVVDKCLGPELAETWLDNPDVQKALHVTAAQQTAWSTCADVDYEKTVDSLLGLYPTLIKAYKVLVYSGDTDACVPHTGSEAWTRSLGFPVADEWRPWLVRDQVAGYVTVFDANSFTFLTVKGAGHMVPQYQPEAAFAMITRWVNGTTF